MILFRFDEQANRIYTEYSNNNKNQLLSNTLDDLLPLTKPGFTVLVDLSDFSPSDLSKLVLPDMQTLFIDYGIRRCAYFSPDTHILLEMNKQVRKLHFKIERGFFTHLDDALHFLLEEPQEVIR